MSGIPPEPSDVASVVSELTLPSRLREWEGCHHSGPFASPLAHYCTWVRERHQPEPPSAGLLRDAHVYGGSITQRFGTDFELIDHLSGQLLTTSDGDLVRASYGVMDGNYSLPKDLIHFDGHRPVVEKIVAERELEGNYYFVGNAHRHFGHFMLEGLSRMWALPQIADPDMLFLLYEAPTPFALALFRRLGIAEERIVVASRHDIVRSLTVPDVAMRSHRWISPSMGALWASMRDDVSPHRKVYLSRRSVPGRRLENEAAVEHEFVRRGFDICSPQDMSVDEQIRLASESTHLAGPVGSQMYLAAFMAPGGAVTVLAPDNFYLKDDVLISNAQRLNLDVTFGTDVDHGVPGRDRLWSIDVASIP